MSHVTRVNFTYFMPSNAYLCRESEPEKCCRRRSKQYRVQDVVFAQRCNYLFIYLLSKRLLQTRSFVNAKCNVDGRHDSLYEYDSWQSVLLDLMQFTDHYSNAGCYFYNLWLSILENNWQKSCWYIFWCVSCGSRSSRQCNIKNSQCVLILLAVLLVC